MTITVGGQCFPYFTDADECDMWARTLGFRAQLTEAGCATSNGIISPSFNTEDDCLAAATAIADATSCGDATPMCFFADPDYLLQADESNCSCLLEIAQELECFAFPCLRDPCKNGATCVTNTSCVDDVTNTYCFECECTDEFTGRFCDQDANPCDTDNGGCDDTCVDGVGAHYCRCNNRPLATAGMGDCASFCDWTWSLFEDRVLRCLDFVTAPVGTPLSGIGDVAVQPPTSTAVAVRSSASLDRNRYLSFEDACGDGVRLSGPFDCTGGCYVSFDFWFDDDNDADTHLTVTARASDGSAIATATSDKGGGETAFGDVAHTSGTWRRVVLPLITGDVARLVFQVDEASTCNANYRVDDVLVAMA
ncbi:hypothetical protein PTSG_03605 [Salpingoeca rosetta]|uniref:EGF-like domain-containing protein n=1 Tax=Salpingoeca rosetta (strain ATCC 50818 / BSB-021) TaxID=946362 RepID=F2U628_SALR5|nr:uncharacterized protein PTSG_03605 [Salpingoeca rosetta]EGD82969.1 hypothetical protein PTSG_03605 [Salpingoeca rosetta]|eukprot:XP_004995333.1 hypothetical protein PTSG_03605 [Salpingoeca rosetta]